MRTGTLFGFTYVVHPAWLLIFALITISLVSSVSGATAAGLSASVMLAVATVVVGLFVVSIVAHEFSHALVARRLGLADRPIQLLTLGRRSESEPDPREPSSELLVALSGPALSVGLGLLLIALAAVVPGGPESASRALYWTFWWLGLANLALGGFHLVPVLPLDGGRIVRAAAWTVANDLDRATAATAFVGRMFGYLVIGSGLFIAISVDLISGMWMVLLGWFTIRLARASVDRRRMETLTAGLTVSDATDTDPAVIPPSLAVETLLLEEAERGGQGVYPVMEEGRLLGFVFSSRLRGPLRRARPDERARDVIIPVERAPSLRRDEPLMRAVEKLEAAASDGLPVLSGMDPTDLYGVVTRTRVLDRLRARHAVTQARDGSASLDVRG